LEVIHDNGEKVRYQIESIQTNDNQTNSGVIDEFINCVRLNREPLVSGADALSSLKVIAGIIEAAETNTVVTI
jgi:predicted dehydrogenase